MKHLLYYNDAYIQQFEATVTNFGEHDGRAFVVLSNTAFYPTGGGQPHDIGTLNGVAVTDVEKVGDDIRHYVSAPVTGDVTGQIDWTRRFDFMQQHAGQHILTAAFVELFDIQTTSFHLGSETVTIDVDVAAVTDEQLAQAESRANDIILQNRPIETKWITANELGDYSLRKDVAVEGDIRLVIIPDFDYNGCGGTHPSSTGQVQMVKILHVEKMKKQTRIHFVCGQRVLHELAMRKRVLSDVARQLSVPEIDAATALQKVMNSAKQTDKKLQALLDAQLDSIVAQLVTNTIATQAFDDLSMQQLQKIARAVVTQNADTQVFLASHVDGKIQIVAARGENVTRSMKDITAHVLPLINGKGGGNDQFVQGGGEPLLTAAQVIEAMQQA
ncbi:alanyl-tRNA editing protein [Caryophanon latum]|uniref:Alanyl-tRNA editing protein n=1 Tax=Caryophanon latum TaxID=33977 RepID=A0A1C0YVQ3_9BACL|nr:DHHA1 domain-containing protein [Caryophanon latum]OCS91243.1 alanyl-tRNA editing protein [Caryophanon latum]